MTNEDGFSWATVRRAKDELGIKARKDGFEGGWQWTLPDTASPPESEHLREPEP